MTISYGTVGSVLTEQPPHEYATMTRHGHEPEQAVGYSSVLAEPRTAAIAPSAQEAVGDYEVIYDDAQGYPMLAFADGHWFDVTSVSPRLVSVRHALRRDPAWAGAVVQTSCLWMRSHPNDERSFDLATELALAVGELARQHA